MGSRVGVGMNRSARGRSATVWIHALYKTCILPFILLSSALQDLADFWPHPDKLPTYVDIEVAPSDETALANALVLEGIQFGAITDGIDG